MGQHPVPAERFFAVLRKYGFSFEDAGDGSLRFQKAGAAVERHTISDPVARRIVMRFAHKYSIPRLEFWPSSLRAVIPDDDL
jgi:hypothetical protein